MEPGRAKVLLVDSNSSVMNHLLDYLRSLGCLCSLAHSYQEACALFLQDKFNLVLGRFAPPDKACHELVALSAGTQASFFYFYAVEHGCWWIPRMRFGRECWGETALPPRQFARVLEKMIQELSGTVFAGTGASAKTERRLMQAPVAAPALQPFRIRYKRNRIAKQAALGDSPKTN